MEYILPMSFLTENGLKSAFSINGVKPDITATEVNSLMDLIILKNVFFASSGALVKKAGAQLTQRNVTKYDLV